MLGSQKFRNVNSRDYVGKLKKISRYYLTNINFKFQRVGMKLKNESISEIRLKIIRLNMKLKSINQS